MDCLIVQRSQLSSSGFQTQLFRSSSNNWDVCRCVWWSSSPPRLPSLQLSLRTPWPPPVLGTPPPVRQKAPSNAHMAHRQILDENEATGPENCKETGCKYVTVKKEDRQRERVEQEEGQWKKEVQKRYGVLRVDKDKEWAAKGAWEEETCHHLLQVIALQTTMSRRANLQPVGCHGEVGCP